MEMFRGDRIRRGGRPGSSQSCPAVEAEVAGTFVGCAARRAPQRQGCSARGAVGSPFMGRRTATWAVHSNSPRQGWENYTASGNRSRKAWGGAVGLSFEGLPRCRVGQVFLGAANAVAVLGHEEAFHGGAGGVEGGKTGDAPLDGGPADLESVAHYGG